jgi:hypothetical protein
MSNAGLIYQTACLQVGEGIDFSEMGYPIQIQLLEAGVYLIALTDDTCCRPPVVCSAAAIDRVLCYLLKPYRQLEQRIALN